ncbi:hypothetical protein [Brevibacillus sp. BC25]|uniref:hypothetical protein n=1 Tax=Brevibacillus sp. BC25 TaxID=1144308 RepID=UPI00027128EE|nr:hypothetical protein [Brevibacillus sp. BC25]EJL29925.1 hypothetical protein PMI05_01540 [Brevibacillus sp. BC25]
MGLSRSERNEDRRDARLARREALEVKAAAAAKKVSKTASSTQQSNTNASKTSVQKASVDKVDISQAARNLADAVPKQALASNNTGVMHGPPIPPKTSSTKTSNNTGAMHGPPIPPKTSSTKTSNNTGVMHGPPIPPKTSSTKTSNNTGVMHGPPIPPKTGKTWGEAGSEAAISATAGTVVTTSVETGGQALLGNSSLPGPISKIIGLGVSTADVYYDAAANLSKGDTKFESNKSISQSITEAATGAIISELGSSALVNAIAVTPAYMQLTPQKDKTTAIMAGLTTGYVISLADSKIGVSPGLAEYVEKEKGRVKESGKKINEYINQGNKKTYNDFSYKEKQAIDKYMNNVAFQNERILKAKVDWEAANRKGDTAGVNRAKTVAKDAREKGGMLSRETTIDRIKELNDKILKEKNNYREAEKNKDKKAQDAARERANAYRTQGGTIR